MEFQLRSFKSWKMMLWKCYTQYASKFGKLSSDHRTGKGQYSFQSQRKAMPKNAQTTAQLYSSQFSSVAQSCLTLCNPMNCRTPAFLSISNSQSPPNPMSIVSMMPYNHLIFCHPLLLLPSRPASGSFQMSQLSTSGGQSIGVSASSVPPVNNQDWSPLGWTGWISLHSKGLSRVFSKATFQKHQFFSAQLSL